MYTLVEVVSDFDTFTVGSKNMVYDALPSEQAEHECRVKSLLEAQLILWCLEHTEVGGRERAIGFARASCRAWTTRVGTRAG